MAEKAASMPKKAPRMKVNDIIAGEKSGMHATQSGIADEKSGIDAGRGTARGAGRGSKGPDGPATGVRGVPVMGERCGSWRGFVVGRRLAFPLFAD